MSTPREHTAAPTTTALPAPRLVAPVERAPRAVQVVLNWGRKYSLWVFDFGLACCAIEFISASMARHDFIRLGVIPFAPGPRQAKTGGVFRGGQFGLGLV